MKERVRSLLEGRAKALAFQAREMEEGGEGHLLFLPGWQGAEGCLCDLQAEGGSGAGVEAFGRAVLVGVLKQTTLDVYCLQVNTLEKAFDVTWFTNAGCSRALEETRLLSLFEVISI